MNFENDKDIIKSYVPLNDSNLILFCRQIERNGVERFEYYDTKILNADEKLVYYYKLKK